MASTNIEARSSDSCVPVSSQATPRPSISTRNALRLKIGTIDVGDLEFAARRRLDAGRDVHDVVVVEIQAGNRVVGLRLLWLFLDAERHAIAVEMHDAITLRILHVIGEYRGATALRVAALRS